MRTQECWQGEGDTIKSTSRSFRSTLGSLELFPPCFFHYSIFATENVWMAALHLISDGFHNVLKREISCFLSQASVKNYL